MILDTLLGWLLALLEPAVAALPEVSTPLQDEDVQGAAGTFASWLDTADRYLPIKDQIRFWVYVLAWTLPGLLTYRTALFIYKRVRG